MKKILLTLLAAGAITLVGYSQTNIVNLNTNTSPPTIGGPVIKIVDFLAASSNLMVVPFGISYENKDGKRKAGGGIGAFYKLSDFVVTGLRLDVLDRMYMPSGGIQLQAPIVISGKVKITLFGFANVATAISDTEDNEPVVGIFGAGLAVTITKNLALVGDVETWTGFPGQQYRAGLVWKF